MKILKKLEDFVNDSMFGEKVSKMLDFVNNILDKKYNIYVNCDYDEKNDSVYLLMNNNKKVQELENILDIKSYISVYDRYNRKDDTLYNIFVLPFDEMLKYLDSDELGLL